MVFQKNIRWISRFSTVYELVLLVDLETKEWAGGLARSTYCESIYGKVQGLNE
jgi:hypothetical protein